MPQTIRIATRSSPLALAQIEEIVLDLKAQGTEFAHQVLKFETTGDTDKTTPLTESRDDFFTDTIDQALLESKADIAIHSAKDLPQQLNPNLDIYALTRGLDSRDAWVGKCFWKDLPSKAKVGTSSVLRQKQIHQMRPDLDIVNIRGTIQERIQLIKESKVDGIVVAACALKRLGLENEIKDIFPWEGMPLQGQLAVVGRRGDHALKGLFKCIDVRQHYGMVYLTGAGPGDAELITLKGIKALERADCVFYDFLVDASLLKYAPQAEHVYVGKRKGEHSLSQDDLNRMLREKAFAGKNVVRLKGGDPLIFGRGADEINYLRSYHIDVEVIPGISSATGIPSSLGVPLTARGIASSVAFLSGHEEDEYKGDPKEVAIPQADTYVFLMGLSKLNIILASLKKAGLTRDTPVMVIANGTKPLQQVTKGTISTIEGLVQAQSLKPPSLILVGKVIDLYKPNIKQTFLHCGTHPDLYRNLGKILPWPMITIKPVTFTGPQQQALLQNYLSADIIVCTSWYAADHLIKELLSIKPDLDFDDKKFAVIGPSTERSLQKFNIKPALVSEEETAQGLFKAMDRHFDLKGKHVLFPRSSLPNPYLKEALIAKGSIVNEVTIYENTKPPKRPLPSENIDGVIFTSPSTVRNFLADYGTIPGNWQIMAKGPVTLKTLQEAGYTHAASLS